MISVIIRTYFIVWLEQKNWVNSHGIRKVSQKGCKGRRCLTWFFFLALLRYNWQITLCEFKLYNVMIWYTYILWNNYHSMFGQHIQHLTLLLVCVCGVRGGKNTLVAILVLLTIVTMLHNPQNFLIFYLKVCALWPTSFHP